MNARFQRITQPMSKGLGLAVLIALLAGCADPLDGVRLQDVSAAADPGEGGAALLAASASDQPSDAVDTGDSGGGNSGSVLGWLFAQKDASLADKSMPSLPDAASAASLADKGSGTDPAQATGEQVQLASLPAAKQHDDRAGRGGKSGFGLFKLLGRSAPEQPTGTIPFGSRTRFGAVGIICEYPKKQLGTLVAQHPEKKPLYRLYDSAPSDEDLRAFYVTGFSDGCLRQVMGTAVVFGSVEMHEQLRYGLPADLHPFTNTDKAYEKLKRRFCKVRRREPCGEKRGTLTPNTVFVSVYDTRDLGQGWANMLLHDGTVLASHHAAD